VSKYFFPSTRGKEQLVERLEAYGLKSIVRFAQNVFQHARNGLFQEPHVGQNLFELFPFLDAHRAHWRHARASVNAKKLQALLDHRGERPQVEGDPQRGELELGIE
jgi:hypothetical protein